MITGGTLGTSLTRQSAHFLLLYGNSRPGNNPSEDEHVHSLRARPQQRPGGGIGGRAEVKTSSTSTTLSPRTTASSAIRNAPWTFSALCARLKPTWLRVALTRRSAARSHGLPVRREISLASAAAWLNCRRQSRKACSGTGATRSASASTS